MTMARRPFADPCCNQLPLQARLVPLGCGADRPDGQHGRVSHAAARSASLCLSRGGQPHRDSAQLAQPVSLMATDNPG